MPFSRKITIFLLFVLVSLVELPNLKAQQNSIRLGVFSLAYGRVNLNYERALGKRTSINILLGAQTPRKFPSGIRTIDPYPEFTIDSGKWRARGITVDFRFYKKENSNPLKGFFWAPFFTYNYNHFYFVGNYYESNLVNQEGVLNTYNTDAHNLSIGVKLGTRWILNEHLSVSITYFGLGVGAMFTNTIFKSGKTSKTYAELAYELDRDINFDGTYLGNYLPVAKSDHIKITSTLVVPVIKFSCSMGYAF